MIKVLHVAAECYPAAKTGGLGDVVGALPKYLTSAGVLTAVVLPKYSTRWILGRNYLTVFGGSVRLDRWYISFTIEQEADGSLGFPLFVVNVPGLFDRPGVYADPDSGQTYGDELERALVFQQAVLHWLVSFPASDRPAVLHCHDHHTGLIPFLVKYAPEFQSLYDLPTVLTIHNGQYQGAFSWRQSNLLPYYYAGARGLLDWNDAVNPLAAGIKCCWRLTTVSDTYLEELQFSSLGMETLLREERVKSVGILNGIDAQVWDPATDSFIFKKFDGDVAAFKKENKNILTSRFRIDPDLPLITFIGRMVSEKGADLLPDAIRRFFQTGHRASFVFLGTGMKWVEDECRRLREEFAGYFDCAIEYSEMLSHQLYAGSDFLIMPSRVEPCGLNQLYSMRYGTVPIVRSVGGLRDTVWDLGDFGGRGIRFQQFSVDDAMQALRRAMLFYYNGTEHETLAELRKKIMALDFSWESSVQRYIDLYHELGLPDETPAAVLPPVEPVEEPAPPQAILKKAKHTPKKITRS